MKDDTIKIKGSHRDFQDIMIMALRYAIGRKTYVSSEVPEFIEKNLDYVDDRVCDVMLVDLIHYFNDCKTGIIDYHQCDYDSLYSFYNKLCKHAQEKNYKCPNYQYWKNQYQL